MDMFVRGKSKPKRRPDPPAPIISTPIPQRTSSHGPNSPSSPTQISSNSAYTSIASTNTDDYFSGNNLLFFSHYFLKKGSFLLLY